jgi:hypothetical protein
MAIIQRKATSYAYNTDKLLGRIGIACAMR